MPIRTSRSGDEPRTRAFLFSDLRDYTALVEAKGDAAGARLLRDYRALVRRAVARRRGAEVKTEGDSFYVSFDSPSTAVECAVAILRAAAARNARGPECPLRIGIGLHAGETAGDGRQPVGSAVNIASRLASHAAAGELLVSDTLRGLVRTTSPYRAIDQGALRLKGVSERIRAWSVRWQAGVGVRRAVAADWLRVERLVRGMGETEAQPSMALRRRFVRAIRHEDHALFIAEAEDGIVGYAWAQDLGPHLRTSASPVRLHDLYVAPERRRAGIGRALFEIVREWAVRRGATALQWQDGVESRAFYGTVGLTAVDTEQHPLYELELRPLTPG